MRVPNVPRWPSLPIVLLSQFRDGGYVLISHCSSVATHQHTLDYDDLIAMRGDQEVDYDFKMSLRCPRCGAPGGGITILPPTPNRI